MQKFIYSLSGLKLTEAFEGVRLTAYRDLAGILTIGYGHTGPDVYEGMTITQIQAEGLLSRDIQRFSRTVNALVTAALTQNEFDALVDFTFNAGPGAFRSSTLLRDLNAGNYAAAAEQFMRWVNAGGHPVPGLVRRRQAEHDLFLRAA